MFLMTNTLATLAAMLLMLVAGIKQKRLEWRPRHRSWWHRRRPPKPKVGA
jgi:hypothetical protein